MAWTSSGEGSNGSVRWQLCSLMCHIKWCARQGMPEWCLWECCRHRGALRRGEDVEERHEGVEPTLCQKMKEKRVENKERREQAPYREGAGELGSTPHVSLKLGSCYFPKKPIFPTPACPSEEVPTGSLRQVSASAVWPRGGLGRIWLWSTFPLWLG